jgi:hypothetical protein
MAAPYNPFQIAFENAIHEFKRTLKDDKLYDEILKTTSINDVYDATDRLQAEQGKKGHLARIALYLERLGDYTGAIYTFVQASPTILSLIRGLIKLILQWASILKQSFDAIVNTIADIGDLLLEFEEVTKLFGYNEHIRDVMVLFFKDLLDFYLIALKFFSMPRTSSSLALWRLAQILA